MFWRGSKTLETPRYFAVAGMSCMRPQAPTRDRAFGFHADSRRATAATRRGSTPCVRAASWIADAKSFGAATDAFELKTAGPNGFAPKTRELRSETSDSRMLPKNR